jgi:hypothetical protein
MLRISSLLLVALVVTPAFAQQSLAEAAAQNKAGEAKNPATEPTREDILKLFDLLQITKTMSAAMKAAKQQAVQITEQIIRDKMPYATLEQKKEFREMVEDVMHQSLGDDAIKEMLDATIPVYQKHLTKSDVEAMVAFYSSPVGQKILQEQPAMVQESMTAASEIQQRIARAMLQKIDERAEKMAEADRAKKP